MPLKSRRTFPPNGFMWFQPQTGWSARPGATFDEVVKELIAHRAANPRFQLSTDPGEVADEVDEFNCLRIANDPNYCDGGYSPKTHGPSLSRFQRVSGQLGGVVAAGKKIVAGVGVLLDWLGEGAKPVDAGLAESRARICADCPQNSPADLTSFFTVPASDMIRTQIEMKHQMKLETPFDDKIGVCRICACPLRTKTWTPIEHVIAHLKPELKAQLPDFCWMLKESP